LPARQKSDTKAIVERRDWMIRAVVLAGLIGCVPTVALAQSPEVIARGQKVYAAEKCSVCHSVSGVGNKRGALDGVGSKLSADDIRQWIVNATGMAAKLKADRKPAMRNYSNLAKEDLDALVAYMVSLKKS
jgi:mono/diheme cytochrome c family protein